MDEKIRMIRRIIMNKVLEEISKIGIVPVIALDHVEDAAPLAKALCDGGLPCAEVTFRTAAAEESIRIMAEQFPEMLVGAGTVLTTEQVDRAVNAGAKFIVSPGLNPKVVKYCVEKGIPVTPGCSNPSDVEVAIELGLDVVKSKIEALGGDVEVKTKYGEGSTFSIRLPLTLAIIQALMVKVGEEKYAIALGSIETIEDVPVSEIKYVHAKEVINLRGNVIPLIRLRELLDVPGEPEESDNIVIVIVRKGDKLAGLVVDNLIGQMEIVIKSLGKYININRMISGATILGDGSVALIIDANTLV